MRKTVMLVLAVILALTACSILTADESDGDSNQTQKEPTSATTPKVSPTTAAPQPTQALPGNFKIDVFWYDYRDSDLATVRSAMEAALAVSGGGITATMYDCEDEPLVQMQSVEAAIAQGSDLLVVNIVAIGSEEVAMSIVNLAREADIPILFFNREITDAVVNSYDKCVFVGTDADEGGIKQGQAVAEFLLSGDNLSIYDLDGDGEIKYIMFRGEHGGILSFGRTLFSVKNANELLVGKAKLVPSHANETVNHYSDDGISNYFLYGNWSASTATDLMRTAITSYSLTDGSIELILANNDDMAIGAIGALKEVGFNTGVHGAGFIPVFGIDATAAAREAIANGKMTATVMQDADDMAKCIVELINNVVDGRGIKDNLGSYIVDRDAAKIRVPDQIIR